jgi:hypothetical protein
VIEDLGLPGPGTANATTAATSTATRSQKEAELEASLPPPRRLVRARPTVGRAGAPATTRVERDHPPVATTTVQDDASSKAQVTPRTDSALQGSFPSGHTKVKPSSIACRQAPLKSGP